MIAIFLSGDLLDLELLTVVIGRCDAALAPARARDVMVEARVGAAPSALVWSEGAEAAGAIWESTASEHARLAAYLARFQAEPREIDTDHGPAFAFLSPHTPQAPALTPEQDRRARVYAAEELMERQENVPCPMAPLLTRASARARAEAERSVAPSNLARGDVREVSRNAHYEGFFRFIDLTLEPRRFDGSTASQITREAFHSIDAALVLPYDPVLDRVLLIEQFRVGPYVRGGESVYVLEPVAGLVDSGETPEVAALREAREEAGLGIDELIPVASGFASPGASSEYFHCFIGLTDLADANGRLGGEAGEGEDIRTHVLDFTEAMTALDQGRVSVVPLAMLLLALARCRQTLRSAAGQGGSVGQ